MRLALKSFAGPVKSHKAIQEVKTSCRASSGGLADAGGMSGHSRGCEGTCTNVLVGDPGRRNPGGNDNLSRAKGDAVARPRWMPEISVYYDAGRRLRQPAYVLYMRE